MEEDMILVCLIRDKKYDLEDMKKEVGHKEISEDHLLEEEEILRTIKEDMIQEENMVVLLLVVVDVVCILHRVREEWLQNKNLVHHNNRE